MKTPRKIIGRGATAEVYDWDSAKNTVVKLFHADYPPEAVQIEYGNSRLVSALDIPVARSHGLVTVEGRYGIVYDKIAGVQLTKVWISRPDVALCADTLTGLHRRILSKSCPAARDIKDILKKNIDSADCLGDACREKLFNILLQLPEEDGLCHGDFHPDNILCSGGECTVIDYMNVCKGHRLFDIARTYYLVGMTPVSRDYPNREAVMRIRRAIAEAYLSGMGATGDETEPYLLLIAAARLAEPDGKRADERESILGYLSSKGI